MGFETMIATALSAPQTGPMDLERGFDAKTPRLWGLWFKGMGKEKVRFRAFQSLRSHLAAVLRFDPSASLRQMLRTKDKGGRVIVMVLRLEMLVKTFYPSGDMGRGYVQL